MNHENNFDSHISSHIKRKGYSADVDEKVPIPTWVWRIGSFINEARVDHLGAESASTMTEQLSDKLVLLSRSIRFRTQGDVEEFFTLAESLVAFSYAGYHSHNSEDAGMFVNEVKNWLDKGVTEEEISVWFRVVSGMIIGLDPIYFKQVFSYTGGNREIEELEGLFHGGDAEIVKNIFPELGVGGPLKNLLHFSKTTAEQFEALGLSHLHESAQELERTIEIMGQNLFQEISVLRPNPSINVITPIAIALSDYFGGTETVIKEKQLANALVSIIRRRRVSLSRESIFHLCAAFMMEDKLGMSDDTTEKYYGGLGLGLIETVMQNISPVKISQTRKKITEQLMPDFIFELRQQGLHNFRWSEDDYEKLGLAPSIWGVHNQLLQDANLEKLPGREVVRKGDVVVEFTTQAEPFHVAHAALLNEVATTVSPSELIQLGLVEPGFSGDVVVGVRVNHKNPAKVDDQMDEKDRRWFAESSLSGMRGGTIFLHPPEQDVNTVQGLALNNRWYRENKREVVMQIRLAGTDKLGNEFRYTKDSEKDGFEVLNTYPHFFALQISDMEEFASLRNKITTLLLNFKNSIVFMVPNPEVHSSYIRNVLPTVSSDALATLVHPKLLDFVKRDN